MNPRKIFWTLLLMVSATWVTQFTFASEKGKGSGKVAVVNGSVITQEEFDREVRVIRQRFADMGRPLGEFQLPALQNQVLESLISRELLYQEGRKKGSKVEEEEIKAEFRRIKERFPSEEAFKKTLSKMKLSEGDLTSQIERGLVIQRFIDEQFAQKVKISEKETRQFYDNNPESFKKPEQVRASHILIKLDPKATESDKVAARKRIEEIRQRLLKGEDFVTLAWEYSEGPSKVKGGDLGYFKRGDMVKPFEEAAFDLKIGQLSDVVETPFGYHLIKVTEKRPETTVAYGDIQERLQKYLKDEKVQEQVNTYVEELKGRSKVEKFLNRAPK